MTYYVYMLTNKSRTVLYIGVTNSLEDRMRWHWNSERDSFVKRYILDRLVCYEEYADIREAIAREKQLKTWSREKKNDLVRRENLKWEDLYVRIFRREDARSLDSARDDTSGVSNCRCR